MNEIQEEKDSLDANQNQFVDKDLESENDTKNPKDKENTNEMDEDEFMEARKKLKGLIEVAQGEASLSQDLISLLITGLKPDVGVKTMSDYLKSNIPTGSLNVDSARPVNTEYNPLITAGWKLESLSNISTTLRQAASRLESESKKEVKYWKEISSLASGGEVLYKTRKAETRDLRIKYGFEDGKYDQYVFFFFPFHF